MALLLRVRCRLGRQEGFGLIEMVAALAILNIGLLALVSSFSSGQVALRRASRIATASALADTQLELYRALKWSSIALDQTSVGTVDSTYKCDSALGTACPNVTTAVVKRTDCGATLPTECRPTRTATGADGKSYRVDTYVTTQTVTNGRDVRRVTVVVRDPNNLSGVPWVRQSSDFDQSTAS
jgi:type II secretory pathway pseudopilin PulG